MNEGAVATEGTLDFGGSHIRALSKVRRAILRFQEGRYEHADKEAT